MNYNLAMENSRKINRLVIDWKGLGENMKLLEGFYVDYGHNIDALLTLSLELGVSVMPSVVTNDPYEHFEPHGRNQSDGYFCFEFEGVDYKEALMNCVISVLEFKVNNKK